MLQSISRPLWHKPVEKELIKEEYRRLTKTAAQKNNKQLSLVIQTICATGIRVSELQHNTPGST